MAKKKKKKEKASAAKQIWPFGKHGTP